MDQLRVHLLGLTALVVVALVLIKLRSPRMQSEGARHEEPSAPRPPESSAPVGFGYKNAWLAVRDRAPEQVCAALHLERVAPASWREGVDRSYAENDAVFVSPPIDGWTLAVGQRLAFFESFLFKPPSDRKFTLLLGFLERISAELGTVQYFFTHRVPETHIWARAEGGRIVRAFAYSGEQGRIVFNVGELSEGELALALKLPQNDDDFELAPHEQTVIDVARVWSIDPTRLHERTTAVGSGFVGKLR